MSGSRAGDSHRGSLMSGQLFPLKLQYFENKSALQIGSLKQQQKMAPQYICVLRVLVLLLNVTSPCCWRSACSGPPAQWSALCVQLCGFG